MIDSLRLFGLVRATVAQEGDQWAARLSFCASGQGDVVSCAGSPDTALKAAAVLFADIGRQRAARGLVRKQRAKPVEIENPEDLI